MKLAVFTPLNPARSGIADYSEALLPHLAEHFDTEVFIDDYEPSGIPNGAAIPIRSRREYTPERFDATLYQVGNNPYHIYIYDMALKHPGIVVLHEYNLHHLIAEATIRRNDWEGYLREVEYDGGPEDVAYGRRVRALEVGPDYEGLAMNRRLLETCRGAIVHSCFMVDQVRRSGATVPVCRIPHGAWIPEVNRLRPRAQLGLDETTPLIGIFGFLKPYKRIAQALRAFQRVVRLDPRARMILVGEEHADLPVRRLISQLNLEKHVRVLGYVALDEFEQWIAACDICLNLRYPTVGEMSGTLLRALGLGRAVLVSDVGSFSELPDDICLKVPVGEGEVDLLTEYLNLCVSRPEVGRAMGLRARNYVSTECSWSHVGERYAEWIRAVAEGKAGTARAPGADLGAAVSDNGTVPAKQPETGKEMVAAAAAAEGAPAASASTGQESPGEGTAGGYPSERSPLADFIRGFCHERPEEAQYVETHLARFIRTLEITPHGSQRDRILEMGAYLHITPALQFKLGYGEVRGCYLGPLGRVDHRTVRSSQGDVFECDIDLFNAEKDSYPYPDGHFATVLCCELLEHLYDDPMHLMAEINRILKPGGHLVLSTPNICSLRAVGAVLQGYHPGLFHQYVKPSEDGTVDPRHAREYAPRDIMTLFDAAGLDVERLETGPYTGEHTAEHEWVKHVLRRYQLPEHLRDDAIYAVGKKVGGVKERYPEALYSGGAG